MVLVIVVVVVAMMDIIPFSVAYFWPENDIF